MLNENDQKKRLAQGVWLDEVDRAFRAWRAAPQADKNAQLLSGMTLTWAESWRMTNPGDFSPATHTFIARSVAVQALKSSGEREASAAETRRRDKVYQQILLLMGLFAIVILAPGTMRLYLEHDGMSQPSRPQASQGRPAAVLATTGHDKRQAFDSAGATVGWSPQSPSVLTDQAAAALLRGDRAASGRLVLEAIYAAPDNVMPSKAASLLAAMTVEPRPAPADQTAFVGAELVRDCGTKRWLARKAAHLLMLDGADGRVRSIASSAPVTVQTAAAVDPTCQSVLVSNEDYDVALEQLAAPATRRKLGNHDAPLVALSFSGDGQRAVSISRDGVGKVWDVTARRAQSRFRTTQSTFNGAAIDRGGSLIVTWSDSPIAELWDATTGAAKGTLKGHISPLVSAAFSNDGSRLLTVSSDGTATVWATDRTAVIATLRPQDGAILSAWLLPDARRVVAHLEDNKVVVWDTEAKQQPKAFETPDLVDAVAISPDGRLIAAADRDGAVSVWDSTTGAKRFALTAGADVLVLAFATPDTLRAFGVTATTTWSLPLTREAAVAALNGAAYCQQLAAAPWCAKTGATEP
jgi:hypothetical protein